MISRRRLIQASVLGGVAVWVWAIPRLANRGPRTLSFTAISGSPPFRRLDSTGTRSALNAALIGLDTTSAPLPDPCKHLFNGAATGIAFFTDANCPNCPEMEANVIAAADGSGLPITHHMLPILGPTSTLAARAFVASHNQTDAQGFRNALMTAAVLPTQHMIETLADTHLLDLNQLRDDMQHPATTARIDTSRAVARRLGLIGTPATIIGRTILLGTLPRRTIRRIITLEQQLEPPCS